MISFIFYFNSRRIENLEQTLRFLNKNENLKNKEVILVCQDNTNKDFEIPDYKIFNLNLDTYMKPKMCNFGVDKAKNDIIALLDADRILPYRYFEKTAEELQERQFVSTLVLHKLLEDYDDEDIELKKYGYLEESKSKTCQYNKKNLFSGSTLFYKKDYVESGGMDESFVGYGFEDNDMTMNILSKGYKCVWKNLIEIHLNHPEDFVYKNNILSKGKFYEYAESNLKKLIKKWEEKNISKLF